jgi:HSP20 family molecular chaperone IbpA
MPKKKYPDQLSKEIKVVLEMFGVSKEYININAYHDYVEVSSNHPHRKYQGIEIPHLADIKQVDLHTKMVYSKYIQEKREIEW